MKIVVLDGYTLNPGDLSWYGFSALGEVEIHDRTTAPETIRRIGDAEAVFTNKVIINKQVIDACPQLKYVGVLATGYNVVDLDAAKKANITVTNIPAYSTDSVAQMVFAHVLNVAHKIALHADSVSSGNWASNIDFSYTLTPQMELAGKTLGIIGFGKIGQRVAALGKAFGMKVIFQNRSVKKDIDDDFKQCSLNELLQQSDVISINCPLTSENAGFIKKETLSLMKSTSILVNTGRGPLINEQDLADALNNGKIAAACLDVLSQEPPSIENPLPTAKNCFITPHIAWATKEARQRLMNIAVANLKAFNEGKPVNVVNN